MKKSALLITAGILAFAACKKESTSSNSTLDCSTVSAKFNTDVLPIVLSSCATSTSCHASGSHEGPGALTTYQQLYSSRDNIRSSVASGFMPQGSTLSTSAKNKILCWIDSGAANN